MKFGVFFLGVALMAFSSFPLSGETLSRVYADAKTNVHVVTEEGKDITITAKGRYANPKLAPDRRTAGWYVTKTINYHDEPTEISDRLAVYRDGMINVIRCDGFIRGFWFPAGGKQVALDCGGMHFAGTETLYDASTLKMLQSFSQAKVPMESRPEWSRTHE